MPGHELAVEQAITGVAQQRDEPGQRDLGGVAGAAEHALTAERAVEPDPVEAADHFPALPAFERMRISGEVQRTVAGGDTIADPAFRMARPWRGAGGEHAREIRIAGHPEPVLADRLRERTADLEPVERNHRPLARLDPIEL